MAEDFDAVVVGAGFAGMYMLHRLRRRGLKVRVFETGTGVGGTWYWNRYPGARCDVESMEYSYQFSEDLQQEWQWTEKYAPQPEILKYANHVADRFDLRKDISFETKVASARFDEALGRWTIEVAGKAGEETVTAKYCIMATGCLSKPSKPHFDGLSQFEGGQYFTSEWPKEGVDFSGRDVGIIGTGSSAIQSIPLIAEQAKSLTVFQRTPNFSVPARNAALEPEYVRDIKVRYRDFREANKKMQGGQGSHREINDVSALALPEDDRRATYEKRWHEGGIAFLGAFNDLLLNKEANDTAVTFLHEKIREEVKDPEVARLLCPDTVAGCKRLCVDTDYFATFNRENVRLVDVKTAPIKGFTRNGLETAEETFPLDDIVFATGFDAMTGALLSINIRGTGGKTLGEAWEEGPKTYLGLSVHDFPNLFMITGPGSPSVLTNMIPSIEQHVEWIDALIEHMEDAGLRTVEATEDAQEEWVKTVNLLGDLTLFPTCNSWYLGANIPGKPRVFMPFVGYPAYVAKCDEVAAKGYDGFALA